MRETIVIVAALLASTFKLQAQDFFSDKRPVQTETEFTRKVNDISYDIDVIIKTNKDKLKNDLNEIEKKVNRNELSKEEADSLRIAKAEFYAKQIEEETKLQEDRIKKLINNKIEDNINFSTDMSAYQKQLIEKKSLFFIDYNFGSSYMMVDGKLKQDYYDTKNVFSSFGVGFGVKTRIGKDVSPWFWRSSFDMITHTFKFNDDKTIESIDNKTELVDVEKFINGDFELKKSTMYMVDFKLSNYIEYDFSKKKFDEFGNTVIKSRQSFYLGAGGFIGYSAMNRNLVYTQNGEKYRQSTGAKFNTNQFVYGVGAYVGYDNISFRYTYNLNHVFKKSFADQNVFNFSVVLELL